MLMPTPPRRHGVRGIADAQHAVTMPTPEAVDPDVEMLDVVERLKAVDVGLRDQGAQLGSQRFDTAGTELCVTALRDQVGDLEVALRGNMITTRPGPVRGISEYDASISRGNRNHQTSNGTGNSGVTIRLRDGPGSLDRRRPPSDRRAAHPRRRERRTAPRQFEILHAASR